MTRDQNLAIAVTAVVVIGVLIGMVIRDRSPSTQAVSLVGAVLRQTSDPRSQMPISDAQITAVAGKATSETTSDSSGFFQITLRPGAKRGEKVELKIRHPGYQSLDMTEALSDKIYIARLAPVSTEASSKSNGSEIAITDVRLRYTTKTTSSVNVGSFAKTFEVANTGGVPCQNHPPCSPDGKWKASMGSASFDAQENTRFVDVRVSCIAGPCPFTRVLSDDSLNGGRTIKVVVLDWSTMATFLVEAEVTRTFTSDMTRHSYPVIFGNGMNFTLPPAAEGPSIEAELNGLPIVFPLGPDLLLSWASCSVKLDADQSKLYGCQLKAGYEFR